MASPDIQLLLLGNVVIPSKSRPGLPAVEGGSYRSPTRASRALDEVHLDALPNHVPKSIHGRWPRYIARALNAGLGPILIFAPRRKAAENLARTLAAALPEPDTIILTAEQKAIAGSELARTLKQRVAFHHSGMSYAQRAALVEPLAKANQLKVIVATTGRLLESTLPCALSSCSTANTVWPKTTTTPRRATADVRPCWTPRPRRAWHCSFYR